MSLAKKEIDNIILNDSIKAYDKTLINITSDNFSLIDEFVKYVMQVLHPPEINIKIEGTLLWRAYQIQVTLGKEWGKNKPGDEGKISAMGAYCCFKILKFRPKHNSRWDKKLCNMINMNKEFENRVRGEVAHEIFEKMASADPQNKDFGEKLNKYFSDINGKYGRVFSDLGVDEIEGPPSALALMAIKPPVTVSRI